MPLWCGTGTTDADATFGQVIYRAKDLLIAAELSLHRSGSMQPTISLDKSFELGIVELSGNSREIDIDSEIVNRGKVRPKSMASETSPLVPQPPVQLKRSTSSILNSPAKKEFNLSRFLVTKPKKQVMNAQCGNL